MPDPVPSLLSSGVSATATTTVSFTAQAAGNLLVLFVAADDYRTTSGTGRPESTGFTLLTNGDQHTFLGHAGWYKLTDGAETSVQYTIGSASKSTYQLCMATNIDQVTPLDIANGTFTQASATTYATPRYDLCRTADRFGRSALRRRRAGGSRSRRSAGRTASTP